MLWLDPRPLESDICTAYLNYYTHDDGGGAKSSTPSRGFTSAMRQRIKRAYIASQLSRADHEINWSDRMLGLLAYLDPTRRADTDFPLKYLLRRPVGRMLDLGCGSGELLGRMRSLGWQTEGVDVDPVAVEAARRNGFKPRTGSLHEQRFPDASFDAVVMSHVIEHVHHPRALLEEVRRVLKPGRTLEYGENLALHFDRDAGEEIALVAVS
jgi:2-polyprenyl-3-methyl-5-hydroxy-6-metoxy-1,4-benzoquinol methylase